MTASQVTWSRDSSKFSLVRRDVRKVKDLWVINPLANPRPTLETYRYAMPGEENTPQSEIFVFDVKSRNRVKVKAERFQDQTVNVATKPQRPVVGAGRGGGGGAGVPQTPPRPQEWLHDGSDKIYFTRLSRDMHRLDVCVADTATGEVRPVIEERLNTYIESKPLRLAGNGSELIFWSERDGWGTSTSMTPPPARSRTGSRKASSSRPRSRASTRRRAWSTSPPPAARRAKTLTTRTSTG